MKTLITLILFLSLCISNAQADLTASVDRQEMFFGESVTLTITSDKNTNDSPDFTMLDPVFHIGQTGKSSSTQIINGQVNTKITWDVLLVPKSIGSHIIPPIDVAGESTQALKILVKKPDPNSQAKGDIFIEVETDIQSAYVQEEIILTVRLLYAINLKNGTLSEPDANGIIVQQINKGANYTTQRDAKTYQVLERKYAIYAESSGPLTLNPIIFEGEVTDNSRRSLGLFQRGRPIRHVSEMLELDIKQIPQAFVNQQWIPAKQLTLNQTWSKNTPYKVGEPITRTINLTAAGLSETQLPDIQFADIPNAKSYQDKTDTMTRTDGQQLIANKVIKYAVIPTAAGKLDIPELNLEWFDTKSQKKRTAIIASTSLEIAEASTNAAPIEFNPIETGVTQITADRSEFNTTENNQLWQMLTYLFAALWLLTMVFLLKKSNSPEKPVVNKPAKEPSVSLKNINRADAQTVQKTLIQWWNETNHQNTTNLSQISQQLANGTIKQAITQLQNKLYNNDQKPIDINWHELIKKGEFIPAKPPKTKPDGLPELYGNQ